MAQRSLEEVIGTIAPSRQPGIPNPPTLSVGVSSEDGDLASALSQAGQQIEQLQSAYQQQANLIQENTQALQSSTSSHSSSGGSVLGGITSGLFGGALGFLSPIISGIASLFGGSSAPTPLPIYTPPPPVSIDGVLQNTPAAPSTTPAATQSTTLTPAIIPGNDTATQSGASADGFSNAALGYLSQIASGITSLFGAGSSTSASAQLAIYTPPAPVPVSGVPQPAAAAPQAQAAPGLTAGSGSQSNAATQVTVNISAMDCACPLG